jgi:hypothetical protein
VRRRVPSIGYTSAGISAVNPLANVIVVDEVATVGGGYAFIYFSEKPLVVVHEPLYGFLYEYLDVAATVGG